MLLLKGIKTMDKLVARIEDIADKASKESGTSYEYYIQLFTLSFDQVFKRHFHYRKAVKIALDYGYVPKKQRYF